MKTMVLFGARSPLVVEYEESCHRAGIEVAAIVSLDGSSRAIAGDRVVDLVDLSPAHLSVPCVVCAFSPQRRRELVAEALEKGFRVSDALVDPTAIIAHSAIIGAGSYINAGCVVGAVARIGENVLVNRSSSIGHHSVIEDFVTIGPGVTLAGNIRVGAGSVIGAGSIILPDLRIGPGSLVAAGSVVRRHVGEGVFIAGNPAVEKPYDFANSAINPPGGE